jgi:DNA-binding transcriptional regulator YbjK
MSPKTDIETGRLLQAAMELVSANGLRAFTLRPLAAKLETTVSALTYRWGAKGALVTRVIEAACAEDVAFLDIWLARIQAVSQPVSGLFADLIDTVFDDLAGAHVLRQQFYCELLQGAISRPDVVAPLQSWMDRRLSFWVSASQHLGRPDLAKALHAYCTDEAAHGLALGDQPAYRWLRRLCLRRLCAGAAPDAGADLELFAAFYGALGEATPSTDERYASSSREGVRGRAARHISTLIIREGADAVTHRGVAAEAGLPSSTLSYHFPRQEDLLRAGLEDIIVRLQSAADSAPDGPLTGAAEQTQAEMVRATFAVALAATRMPNLKSFAADMRRRRGENLHKLVNRHAPADAKIDRLTAQSMAIEGIGAILLSGVTALSVEPARAADAN